MRLGLFDPVNIQPYSTIPPEVVNSKEHQVCVCACVCVSSSAVLGSALECCLLPADMVRLLLSHGASPNDTGRAGNNSLPPLHDACSNMHVEVVRVLLEGGADPSTKSGRVRITAWFVCMRRVCTALRESWEGET